MPKEKNKMCPYYYCDVESEGLSPQEHKILTIQFQRIDNFGNPSGDLIILREWELGEEEMIKRFFNIICTENCWNFAIIGQNTLFDIRFILEKFKKYNLDIKKSEIDFLYSLPIIDIHSTLVILNNLNFKGSGLDSLTNKKQKGDIIPKLYQEKNYLEIENYIKNETKAFLEAFKVLCVELPKLKPLLKKENGNQI
jgi:hypothetical protein